MGAGNAWLAGPGTPGLVSVITPAYNHGRYLGEMLASVMAQTYSPVEAIIVDDGSTDNTAAVAQAFAERFGEDRVRFFQGEHQGSQKTRNRALAECKGEFIQLLDSDDLIHQDKFRLQVAVLQSRPDLDFVVGQYNYFIDPSELPEPRPVKGLPPLTLQSYFQRRAQIHVVAPLFRRESLRRVGPSDERLVCCDETNFFGRVLALGLQSAYTPGAFGWYRLHHRNMRRTIDWRDRLQSGVCCFSGICEAAEKHGTGIPVELRLSLLTSRSRLRALLGDRIGALDDLQESLRILPQKHRKRKLDLKIRYWLLRIAGEKAYTMLADNLRRLSGKGLDRLPGGVRRQLAQKASPEEIS